MQECPRDTDPLFFSAGQRIAEFSDFGVVAVWQCHDEIMYGRLLRRLHNFFPRRAGFCNSDVVRNRIVEQMCLLRHDTMEVESKDYLQVFELSEYDGMQKIVHSQEMPEYKMEYLIKLQGAPIFVGKVYVIDDKTHSTMLKAEEY